MWFIVRIWHFPHLAFVKVKINFQDYLEKYSKEYDYNWCWTRHHQNKHPCIINFNKSKDLHTKKTQYILSCPLKLYIDFWMGIEFVGTVFIVLFSCNFSHGVSRIDREHCLFQHLLIRNLNRFFTLELCKVSHAC